MWRGLFFANDEIYFTHNLGVELCVYFISSEGADSVAELELAAVDNHAVLCLKRFCDILCGRLYDVNIQPIEPMMKDYNRSYITNKLTAIAKLSFERFNDYMLFKMIPVCSTKESPEATKRYYLRLFGI